jgi:hypothetical protein
LPSSSNNGARFIGVFRNTDTPGAGSYVHDRARYGAKAP